MRVLVVVAVLVGLVACAADPYGDRPPAPASSASTQSCKASQPVAGEDPSGLKVCSGTKGTKGRCVAVSMLGSFKDTFEQASCAKDEGCVPDEVVKQGSSIKLTKCTAVLDGEGRCFWPLAKDILASYELLKGATKNQCPAEMVCAPCVHPVTKADTGVCSTGASASCGAAEGKAAPAGASQCPQIEPNLDVSSFTAEDCGSGMLCVDTGLVGDMAKSLKDCKKGKCAPKKSVERGGNYVPKTCRSTGDVEGRCLNVSIPQIAEQAALLPPGEGCDPDERCAPCFDPRTGADTSACKSASCDAPKEPKKVFPSCCGGRARCVPASAVDAESADMLAADTCTGDAPLCAPNELVGVAKATKCTTGFGLIAGLCLSKCAIDTIVEDLVQGSCGEGDMCAPCRMLPAGSCN